MKLFQTLIRLPKEEAAFAYFQFEAREGLAFYSTLEHPVGAEYRDLLLTTTLDFEENLMELLDQLRKEFPIDILNKNYVEDSRSLDLEG